MTQKTTCTNLEMGGEGGKGAALLFHSHHYLATCISLWSSSTSLYSVVPISTSYHTHCYRFWRTG